jgi:hypothetical protein
MHVYGFRRLSVTQHTSLAIIIIKLLLCACKVYAVFVFQSFHRLSFQQHSVIDNRLLFGFFCNIFAQMTAENDAPSNDEQKAKKRKERLEQNRISARESRKRKKTMIEELQRYIFLWKEVLLCLACSHTDFFNFLQNGNYIVQRKQGTQ